jgi:hypothetical protein
MYVHDSHDIICMADMIMFQNSTLTLLHSMLMAEDLSYLDSESISLIISHILVANSSWRAGRVATALRLQAILSLLIIFAKRLVTPTMITTIRPTLLPVIHVYMSMH